MLDNLSGSGLSEQEVVAKMQSARGAEDQSSEPIESTDETVPEEAEAEDVHEELSEAEFESDESEYEEEEETELYTVKVDGKELEVTLDELVGGYQKDQDYRNKTAKIAEERKAIEAERAQMQADIEKERQSLQVIHSQLKNLVEESEQSIDWEELRDTDPSEYLRQKELLEKRKTALGEAQQQAHQQRQVKRQEMINAESHKLLSVIGDEWKDPEVKQKDLEGMYNYVFARGITQEEANNLIDHRFWLMVRDAMKGQEIGQMTEAVKKQIKKAPKTVKSKKAVKHTGQEMQDIRKQLRNSGGKDIDAVVKLMKAKRNNR